MHIASIWHPGLRIVEIGATSGTLGGALVRAGYHQHYLAVAPTQRALAKIAAAQPSLAARLTVAKPRQALRSNNGEVLVLRGVLGLYLARFRRIRHAHYVALPITVSPLIVVAFLLGLVQCLLGRLSRPTLVDIGRGARGKVRLIAFGVRRRRNPSVRRYVPHTLGIERFLRRLNRQRIRYVVLRWFDALPVLPPGEDLDLLVDDADLPAVIAMLDEGPGLQPVDLYSTTGLPGADYRDMPYFPPHVAAQILDGARPKHDLCWVPSHEDHFNSLAYHALYHKGFDSGLPSNHELCGRAKQPEHNYTTILEKLARQHGLDATITLEDLDAYLDARGWRPPHDMLVRLARHNRWIRRLIGGESTESEDAGLAVFLVRQRAMGRGGLERATALVQQHGFSIVRAEPIPPERMQAVARSIRGGNWGAGPWPTSGGPPAGVIVAYDIAPTAPTRRQRARFPFVANARLLCKDKIRDALNDGVPHDEHCNTIHSSDNGREALDYLRVILPQAIDDILAAVGRLRDDFATAEPVLATWTRAGRRAKVELVKTEGRFAVKKTFRPHQERFCHREANALAELSRSVPQVPHLLDRGPCWLMMPYYEDVLRYRRSCGKLLPLPVAKQAIAALARVYEAGYAIIDASIDNLLVDRQEGLKLIDFEFCHRYDQCPSSFLESYDVVGVPSGFSGDVPIQGANSYDRNWRPYVGLSLASLLHDPTWLQHTKRAVYYVLHAYRFLPRLARHYFRALSAVGRRGTELLRVHPKSPPTPPRVDAAPSAKRRAA